MEQTSAARQVWMFLKERDQWHGRPLFLGVRELLRREGVAGATAWRGIAGYGAHGQLHTATLVELASDLPVVVTFVDRADRFARVLPLLAAIAPDALISAVPADVLASGHRSPGPFPAHLTVADVMTHDVALVQPDTPVSEVAVLLIDRALRTLPVVDAQGRLIGLIGRAGVLAALSHAPDSADSRS
ncbi:MAG TPA: DUF190 domain-containing protein [Roseiflexaceae bacterium]